MIAQENILPAIVLALIIILGCAAVVLDAFRRSLVQKRAARVHARRAAEIAAQNTYETARRMSMAAHPAGKGL